MQVDKVAMMQGVINAHTDKKIPDELYEELMKRFQRISKPGKVGRHECDYAELLKEISEVDARWLHLVRLWEYLGKYISSGISVAN